MTQEQAEEIFFANQVGMFKGTAGELAEAILILTALEKQYQSEEPKPE